MTEIGNHSELFLTHQQASSYILVFFKEILYDRTNVHDFFTLTKQIASPGVINQSKVFNFQFPHVEKPYESYFGTNVRLRYFCRTVYREIARHFLLVR